MTEAENVATIWLVKTNQKGGANVVKVKTLDERAVYDIGHAFGYYDYGEERGLNAIFSSQEAYTRESRLTAVRKISTISARFCIG